MLYFITIFNYYFTYIQINDEKKKVSSAVGMKRTVDTSELLQYRAKYVVPKWAEKMQIAIMKKDFSTFAELTMKDSDQMHAVCLDSYPPVKYMNDISFAIVNLIHSYNTVVNDVKVLHIHMYLFITRIML